MSTHLQILECTLNGSKFATFCGSGFKIKYLTVKHIKANSLCCEVTSLFWGRNRNRIIFTFAIFHNALKLLLCAGEHFSPIYLL
ncbi:hypothetical protein FKM82_013622 [Ascaphus truei]